MQGAQVFIKYGQHTNDTLLLYYGFVEPGIPHDTYVVSDLAAAAAAAGEAAPSVDLPATKACCQGQMPVVSICSSQQAFHVFL